MNSYLGTFFRGSAISLLGTGILGIANYLIRRTLCNGMSLSDYGVFYGTFALFSMIFGFTDLGLTQSGTMMIAAVENDDKRDTVFSQLFMIKCFAGVLCAAALFVYYNLRGEITNSVVLVLFLLYFVVQILNGTLQALWGGQKKYLFQQLDHIAIAVLTLILLHCMGRLCLKISVLSFFCSIVLIFLIGLIFSKFYGLGTLCFRFNGKIFKQLISAGGIVALTTTLLSVMYYMDTVMLNALNGAQSAGLYNVALPVMQIVQSAMIFPAVFLPIAVNMSKVKEYKNLLLFVRYALIIALAALVPVWLFFNCSSKWIISILFKPEYAIAAPVVTLLCLGLVFFTLGNFLFQIMLSLGKIIIMAVIAVFSAGSNLLLNFYFIRSYDINGAAWATLISYTIFALLTYAALEYNLNRVKKNECVE